MADFGYNLHSSDSWRARRNFVFFLLVKQALFHRFSRLPDFTKFEHKMLIGVTMKTFGTVF